MTGFTGDAAAALVSAGLCLVLVMSGLAARRLPIAAGLRMAIGWVLIFVAAFAVFALRGDLVATGRRMLAATDPSAGVVVGGTLRVPMAADGHFWIRGEVNGVETRFLVDSGATTTALSRTTADAAEVERRGGLPVLLNTANGVIEAERVRIDRLEIGPIEARRLAAVSAPAFGGLNVLGMNFLSSLKRWGVEDNTLILEP